MIFYKYEAERKDRKCCFEIFIDGRRGACLKAGYGQIGKTHNGKPLCKEHFNLMLSRNGLNKNDVHFLYETPKEKMRLRG